MASIIKLTAEQAKSEGVVLRLPYGFAQLFILENDNGNEPYNGMKLDNNAAAKIVASGFKDGPSNYWIIHCSKVEACFLAKEFAEIYHPQGIIYEYVHSDFTSKADRLRFATYMRTARRYAPQVLDTSR